MRLLEDDDLFAKPGAVRIGRSVQILMNRANLEDKQQGLEQLSGVNGVGWRRSELAQ